MIDAWIGAFKAIYTQIMWALLNIRIGMVAHTVATYTNYNGEAASNIFNH